MIENEYIPAPGDVMQINITELVPRKQGFVLVVSPLNYQKTTGLSLVCPVVFKSPANALEIRVPGLKKKAVVLADQVRSLDFSCRKAQFIIKTTQEILEEVKRIIRLLVN